MKAFWRNRTGSSMAGALALLLVVLVRDRRCAGTGCRRISAADAAGHLATIWLLVVTSVLGLLLAIPLGLAQAAGPWYLAQPGAGFCTVIRGTPLLLQLWLLYYGLGSLFPQFPWIRQSDLWPILRQAWPYAVLALTLSFRRLRGRGHAGRL